MLTNGENVFDLSSSELFLYENIGKGLALSSLLVACLIWLLLGSAEERRNRTRIFVTLAVAFGLAGDMVLIHDSSSIYFVIGLALFLVGHVFYTTAFSISPQRDQPRVRPRWLRLIPIALTALPVFVYVLVFWAQNGKSAALLVAAVVYGLVSLSVIWRSLARIGSRYESGPAEVVGFIGTVFFVASDSMLAYSNVGTLPIRNILVLSTYWLAQLLIVLAYMIPWRKPTEKSIAIEMN